MPTFTIDGRELTVPDGTTVLQAALANGIEIPHFCYHPGLRIAGNCRICLVEVEKFPKPAIACNTVVAEGMVVHTDTDRVRRLREAVMEFLLINHPLDCPVCDQAGECRLQEYGYRHGRAATRFREEKEHGPKRRVLGPHVIYDWERCIKCTRCIRFCQEVTGTAELGMFHRGVREEIGTFPGRPLDNPYSGCVVDLCPVGALTLREFRFRSRVWFLTDVPSVCPGCARGCSVHLGTFRNEIQRITPRPNHAVNRWWICDEGRLWGGRLEAAAERRLSGPRSPVEGKDDPWRAALEEAVRVLGEAARAGKAAVLASPRMTVEEAWLLGKLAAGPLGGAPVFLPEHVAGEDDDLLVRADRAPNARGVREVLGAVGGAPRPVDELETLLRGGGVTALLAIGPGLLGPVDGEPPVLAADAAACAPHRVVLDAWSSPLAEEATVVLPVAGYGEQEGTWVSFAGRVQHVARALWPRGDCRPGVEVLGALLAGLAGRDRAPRIDEIRAAVAEEVPAFAGIDWASLPGSTGQDLAGEDAARAAAPATGALVKMLAVGWAPAEE